MKKVILLESLILIVLLGVLICNSLLTKTVGVETINKQSLMVKNEFNQEERLPITTIATTTYKGHYLSVKTNQILWLLMILTSLSLVICLTIFLVTKEFELSLIK